MKLKTMKFMAWPRASKVHGRMQRGCMAACIEAGKGAVNTCTKKKTVHMYHFSIQFFSCRLYVVYFTLNVHAELISVDN